MNLACPKYGEATRRRGSAKAGPFPICAATTTGLLFRDEQCAGNQAKDGRDCINGHMGVGSRSPLLVFRCLA